MNIPKFLKITHETDLAEFTTLAFDPLKLKENDPSENLVEINISNFMYKSIIKDVVKNVKDKSP